MSIVGSSYSLSQIARTPTGVAYRPNGATTGCTKNKLIGLKFQEKIHWGHS